MIATRLSAVLIMQAALTANVAPAGAAEPAASAAAPDPSETQQILD